MSITRWNPSKEITPQEKFILNRCKKTRKLFSFLREVRSQLFDDETQDKLAKMYRDTGAGKKPLCPAMMAMALIIQGYLRVSDGEAIELTVVDLRWQMVLDRIGETHPAFSQGALFDFRERLIENELDLWILQRTAELARSTKGFDAKKIPKTLCVAIDSSPLAGAGRVEDTINLIGHAARKVVECIAELLECKFETVCQEAGIPLLLESSIKKALDRDWSDAVQKAEAVNVLAKQVLALERWIDRNLEQETKKPPLSRLLKVLHRLIEQDLEPDPKGGNGLRIKDGVAPDRQISVEDEDMRHGRKSKSKRIDGYKRHVATDLDSKAILSCAVTPANRPEHEALPVIKTELEEQKIRISEVHFDRGYIASPSVDELENDGVIILCKPWKSRNGKLFTKEDFVLNLREKTITCPAGNTEPIEFGTSVNFNPSDCDACSLREQCTEAKAGTGRSVNILEDERRQKKLRDMAKTKSGRQRFRERVPVEHSLAHIGQRQGRKARYCGTRKNLFDLRRAAAIQNLEIIQRRAAA